MLFALEPGKTERTTIEGVHFDIAPLPFGLWQRVKFRQAAAYEAARRKAIRDLSKEGSDPEAVVKTTLVGKDGKAIEVTRTLLDKQVMLCPDFHQEMGRIAAEVVRWTVKGHEGLTFSDGRPVPLETVEESFEEEKHTVLAPSTLAVYRRNHRLLEALAVKAEQLSDLGVGEKKG